MQLPLLLLIFLLGLALGLAIPKPKRDEPLGRKTPQEVEVAKPQDPRPEQPEGESYVVQPGDTLFTIGLRYNVNWLEIARANNLQEPYKITAGQKLVIPKARTTETPVEIDKARFEELQRQVDLGAQPWRLDPIEVVKAEAPAKFAFTAQDRYSILSKDTKKGEAIVRVEKIKEEKTLTYEVQLIQPVKIGDDGIWAITAVREALTSP